MPRIDFYLIPETDVSGLLRFTCRLLEKAFEQKHSVFILTEDTAQASQLNDLLWTFKDTSFIPHQLIDEMKGTTAPIQIGSHPHSIPTHRDILINLRTEIPSCFDQFDRVIEIIFHHESSEKTGRDHARLFQEKGLTVNTFDLIKKEPTPS